MKDWQYNPETLSRLLRMALPMVVSQGAFAVMIFTDRWFLAQLSPTHMAAALGGGVTFYLSISLFQGIIAYANALVAQYFGAGEFHKCTKVITQGILIAIFLIPALVILTLILRNLFGWMGHTAQQEALEKSYYTIMMAGGVLTLVKVALASFYSGIGRTRIVMTCDVLGILVNIPLTWALVFGHFGLPAMGIAGAALGTILSTAFSIAIYLLFYLKPEYTRQFATTASLGFDQGIMRRYIRLGLPSGTEVFLNIAAFNGFLLMFQGYGIAAAASATIVFNWDILSFVPLLGLNIAVMSMIGRFVGADDMDKANEVITAGYILGLGYSLLLATCFLVFRNQLVEVFIFFDEEAEEIRSLSRFMMIGLGIYAFCEGVLQVAAGVLRGAGDTRWVMVASVTLHWIMLVAQFFVIRVLDYGPRVSWMGFVLMILAICLVFLGRLWGNRWRDPDRLTAVMAE